MLAFGVSEKVALCSLDKLVYILSAPSSGVRGKFHPSRESAGFDACPPCGPADGKYLEYLGKSNKADCREGGVLVLHRLISMWLQCDASLGQELS
jgi:hypothetical protein